MPTAYLGLGSNLGDRVANLRDALKRLGALPLSVTGVSSIYETVPVGETQQPVPLYLNCVVRIETDLDPYALLEHTQSIEKAGGRVPTFHWGPRTIDIDVLLYWKLVVDSERLVLPHPRLFERAFVLIPLAELAPDLVFPDGMTLAQRLVDPQVQAQNVTKVLSAECWGGARNTQHSAPSTQD